MKISQAFKLAVRSILGSKLRSFLTMLGMIIGVASVITLVGLVQGVTNYIISSFGDLGSNMVMVNVTNTDTRKIKVDGMYQFVKENSNLFQAVTPNVSAQYTIKYGTNSLTSTVTGVGEDYLTLNNKSLSEGRFIQYADIKNRYNGCVIGTYVKTELFGEGGALGNTIKINGQVYKVVGIQEEQSDSTVNSDDDCIYIPYSNATRMVGSSDISSYTLTIIDVDEVEQAKAVLDNYLYSILKSEDLYNIITMAELLDMVNSMTGMLSSILGGIAGISLLVAGIGIMNIMLVSVVERTKEIGIRKSLGAKKRDIMWQFVIEAAAISTIGGGIGILIGSAATTVLGTAFGLEAAPTVGAIILAFSVSAGIGISFGYMPANKAANLNPIDALRCE